ncbi:MAG: Na+/H+ antiporter NhaC family protein [Elusimicrobiota bacterium]|jgi:Na+/H+ antiporter NhaC|nr:Na+/H+ antiporter NhaC family protein [Elusimicrobiota bacterium]
MNKQNNLFVPPQSGEPKANVWALAPLAVFLFAYLVASLIAGDFYKMPITVAFVLAAAAAVIMMKKGSLQDKTDIFCKGAGNGNIMLMVVIFILAGMFAKTAKDMGAVDCAANFILSLFPPNLLAPGLFVAACFLSMAMGTSVGTIVALVPVAAGLAAKTGISPELMSAVVVSGAMFGDNLSFISDTTIVATRTQGCKMSDKFKTNFRIVFPFAVITAILYFFAAKSGAADLYPADYSFLKVVPYLFVLASAIAGMNVMAVLTFGTLLAGAVGLIGGSFTIWGWTGAMGGGINAMGELIIVTVLAGGMFETIKENGGVAWIINKLQKRIKSQKGAEFGIAVLVCFANFCTANNTIALIMTGPIAKDISVKFKIPANKTASIMDISSCFVQGIIPYGAQLLMAAGLAQISPVSIMKYLYYPYLLGVGALTAIFIPRLLRVRKSKTTYITKNL